MENELSYEPTTLKSGYNDRTLYINLSTGEIKIKPVSKEMKELFVGGRGFNLWLLWHALPKERIIRWDDPENELCISCGPLGGTTIYPGAGKSIVVSISPLTDSVMDSNVGGYFGPYLKFAGFDALEIQGKSEDHDDIIVYIDGVENKIKIERFPTAPIDSHLLAPAVMRRYAGSDQNLRFVSAVTTGSGARHALFGCLNFFWYDVGRKLVRAKQAGRGGLGTVFANKGLRALVVRVSRYGVGTNAPADLEGVKAIGREYNAEIRELDPKQNRMSKVGTTYLVSIMNEYDLLPVHNFRYGSHHLVEKNLTAEVYSRKFHSGFDGCWVGCMLACAHCIKNFELTTGPYKGSRVYVDGPEYETIAGVGSNCGIFDADTVAELNFYCDTYGIDTISFGTTLAFVMECFELGIITTEHTGGLELNFGNAVSALEILHQIAQNRGFGKLVGLGVRKLKHYFIREYGADAKLMADIGMECKGLEFSEYVTKESLAQQGGYGLALKGAQHDEAWLVFMDMVHKSIPTFEAKAEALHWFPMWRTWFGLNGLCKLPWNDVVPEDNKYTPEPAKIMKHVENYVKFYSAVTGRKVTVDDLILMSERVYNFQRVFNLRMGFGTSEHDDIPYRAMGPVTVEEYNSRRERYDKQLREILKLEPEKMSVESKIEALRKHREQEYQKLKLAVYKRRGWTERGVPTIEKLQALGIDFQDVIEVVKAHL